MHTGFRYAFAGAAFAVAAPAAAHHSFAMFDNEKTLTLDGTVKEFELTNPHAWLYVVTVDAQGKPDEWGLEMGGTAAMERAGWKADTVKPGDKIVVEIHPLKDGTHGGQFLSAKFGGRAIEGGDIGLPPALR